MMSPVHGFTSGNTSSNGNAVGGSAAAGTANARATTLNRPTTSLITGLRLEGGTPRRDADRSRQALQAAAPGDGSRAPSSGWAPRVWPTTPRGASSAVCAVRPDGTPTEPPTFAAAVPTWSKGLSKTVRRALALLPRSRSHSPSPLCRVAPPRARLKREGETCHSVLLPDRVGPKGLSRAYRTS